MTNEELVKAIHEGEEAENNLTKLYQQNLGIINNIVRRYLRFAEYEDLMQEAYIGLHKAVQVFDPEMNVAFATVAGIQIHAQISKYVRNYGRMKRIPSHMIDKQMKYKSFIEEYTRMHGKAPEDKEICFNLGISENQLRVLEDTISQEHIISLSSPVSSDNECELADTIMDPGEDVETIVEDRMLRERVWQIVDTLESQQRDLVTGKYKESLSLKELASQNGYTVQNVRIVIRNGFEVLRKKEEMQQLSDHFGCGSIAYGGGSGAFKRTWTSPTERAAFKNMEMQERRTSIMKSMDNLFQEIGEEVRP